MKKTAIIGASGTIGSAIAFLLKENRHQVLEVSRRGAYQMDMEDPESITTFFDQSEPLDAIICAAGSASFGTLEALTDDQISLGIKSKLLGQVNICRKGIKALKPNGVMILTGGILAHEPWPETSNIAMVNAAIEGFAKAVALELSEGRRILVVHPPLVKESAQSMGIDDRHAPSAMEIAQTYVDGLTNHESGTAIYWKTPEPKLYN